MKHDYITEEHVFHEVIINFTKKNKVLASHHHFLKFISSMCICTLLNPGIDFTIQFQKALVKEKSVLIVL